MNEVAVRVMPMMSPLPPLTACVAAYDGLD